MVKIKLRDEKVSDNRYILVIKGYRSYRVRTDLF